jgi:glycerol-3-phosphate dehydrogenase
MALPPGISTLSRAQYFQEAASQEFDVLVIGGGITGAGIALDAASRGLKVLLVEKQDFAAGTSSRSTKLIHGGLRYLKNLEFKLVHEVAKERKVLHRNAPHLVIPEPMLLPVLKKASFGYWVTAAGLTLYEMLGQVPLSEWHRMLNKKRTLLQEPLLNPDKLKGSGLFFEYRTDDARLTLEVLKTARAFGALCLNYSELQSFLYQNSGKINGAIIQDNIAGSSYEVKAKCIINATGPWSIRIMEQDQKLKAHLLYPTKGVHLVVPFPKLPLKQSVYFDITGGRMLFAIPRNHITYLGTTDTPFAGDFQHPEVTKADADYLLEQINQMFPSVNLKLPDVVSSWAGIRPLLYEEGKKPSEISRKDEIFVSTSGLITVAGGKLTGYRYLAEKVVDKALKLHFPNKIKPSVTRKLKLCGGNFKGAAEIKVFEKALQNKAMEQGFSPETIPFLIQKYGTNSGTILSKAIQLKAITPDAKKCLLMAEIWYTITEEGAATISDFLIRRTGMLYFEREKIEGILPVVIAAFRENLDWNEAITERYVNEFKQLYEASVTFN